MPNMPAAAAGRRGRGDHLPGAGGAAAPPPRPPPERPHAMIAPRLLPRTVQLCIHCQHNPAGFWVSRTSATPARRPWCLTCCAGLDRGRHTVTPFDAVSGTGLARRAGHDGAAGLAPGRQGRHRVLRLRTVLTGRPPAVPGQLVAPGPLAGQLAHGRLW